MPHIRTPLALAVSGAIALGGVLAVGVDSVAASPSAVESTTRQPDAVADLALQAVGLLEDSIADGQADRSVPYVVLRSRIASEIAVRLGADRDALRRAWATADPENQLALMAALSQLGVRYRSNASEPGVGFDCSGLTSFAWGIAGVQIPRSSGDQISAAARRDASTAQAGDLVQYPGHVMMWLGVGSYIVHSPYSGRVVEVDTLSERRMARVRFGDPTD